MIIYFILLSSLLTGQPLPGFKPSGTFGEQQMVIEDSPPGTRILINAPPAGPEATPAATADAFKKAAGIR